MSTDDVITRVAAPGRSTFVTVIAWVFIVGAGMVVCVSILQAIMFVFIFPTEAFWSASNMSLEPERTPPLGRFVAANMLLVFGFFWLVAVAMLVAAIGLLRRRNWARLAFIGLLALAILANIAGLWLQNATLSSFPATSNMPAAVATGYENATIAMKIASTLSALAMSVLFAWIIKQLVSPATRNEFGAQ